jgi:hypothetical protein
MQSKSHASEATEKTNQCWLVINLYHGWSGLAGEVGVGDIK